MFKSIDGMSKSEILNRLSQVKNAQVFINSKPIKIAVMAFIAFVWIKATQSEEIIAEYEPAMLLNAVILLTIIFYAMYSLIVNKTLNFIVRYFTRLIDIYNVQTVNDVFDNRYNDGYVFDYCFGDPDRGDIVSVKCGKNAGDYVIKPFFDKDRKAFSLMINSVGMSPFDSRYKSLMIPVQYNGT